MHDLASVVIGNTVIAPGLILVIITIVFLVLAARKRRENESSKIPWVLIAMLLGLLLAAAFPVLAADINKFFAGIS